MPRSLILSSLERQNLLAIPDSKDEMIRQYTFNETDLSIIRQRRGCANRLGFAILLCYMRYPGIVLRVEEQPFEPLLQMVATQLKVPVEAWMEYGRRSEMRHEHLIELQSIFGFRSFTMQIYRSCVQSLDELAWRTDKGIVLASELVEWLRRQSVLLPSVNVIEQICTEAITHAKRRIYAALADPLSVDQRKRLNNLLQRKHDSSSTWLGWLRQSPAKPNSRYMLEHIERLKVLQATDLPLEISRKIHQNRLLKIAREGGQMTPADLSKFEPQRRYATLVALALEITATVTDEIIDLHDRILGKLFNAAKSHHQQQFQDSSKSINEKLLLYGQIGKVLLEAKQSGVNPFAAIESVISWDDFIASITEVQKLAQPDNFDFLHRIGESYATLRRYAPEFLNVLKLRAAPTAKSVLNAIVVLLDMNADKARKVPFDTPTEFIKKRWQKLVFTDAEIDQRYYELCVMSELKNALRSGDIWVHGSRQFKDFDEYLIPIENFATLDIAKELSFNVPTDCDHYLQERLQLLEKTLVTINCMAKSNSLPDAIVTEFGLKITQPDAIVPDGAQELIDQVAAMMPHVKITELLMEVEEWTGFTKHFTHLKTGDVVKDKKLLLTMLLADSINLGLTKMAESCPGTTYAKLAWLQAWHIQDETYSAALAELVNAQFRQPFAENWGNGSTSSSDGQRFKSGGKAESTGHVNPKYGIEPGRMFYTHISDQYAPFNTKVINVGVRDSTYV